MEGPLTYFITFAYTVGGVYIGARSLFDSKFDIQWARKVYAAWKVYAATLI